MLNQTTTTAQVTVCCARCNRPLTNARSIARGMGTVCASKSKQGIADRVVVETVVKSVKFRPLAYILKQDSMTFTLYGKAVAQYKIEAGQVKRQGTINPYIPADVARYIEFWLFQIAQAVMKNAA